MGRQNEEVPSLDEFPEFFPRYGFALRIDPSHTAAVTVEMPKIKLIFPAR